MSSPKTKPKKPAPKSSASKKAAKPTSASAGTAKRNALAAKVVAAVKGKKAAPKTTAGILQKKFTYTRVEAMPLANIAVVYNARTSIHEDDPETLELIESIRSSGLHHDLWVYRLPKPGPKGEAYGLIAGERRSIAVTKLGWIVVPVRVYEDVTAADVISLGLVDNLQRQQISDLDAAFAYRKLIDEQGLKAWDEKDKEHSVGHQLGKSKTNIYAMLKLIELPKLGLDAVRSGALSPSAGTRIARVPDDKARMELLKMVLDNSRYYTDERLAEEIERRYMKELKGAPFDRKDATLNPARGTCDGCPYRTGNQAELFPQMAKGRGDVCTDPACFRLKCEKAFTARAAVHILAGGKVLTKKEAETAGLHTHGSYPGGNWAELDQRAYQIGQDTTWRAVLQPALADGRFKPVLALANDGSGRHFELGTIPELKKIATELGVNKQQLREDADAEEDEKYAKERAERELNQSIGKAVRRAVVERVGQLARAEDGWRENATTKVFLLPWLTALLPALFVEVYDEAAEELLQERGITPNEQEDPVELLHAHLGGVSTLPEVMSLFTRGVFESVNSYGMEGDLAATARKLAGVVGVNLAEIEKGVRQAAQSNGKVSKKKGKNTASQPLLWEQLDAKSRKNLEEIYGDKLDRTAQFLIDQGAVQQIPIDEPAAAQDAFNPEHYLLEIDFVLDARQRDDFTVAQIAQEFEISTEEAEQISRYADSAGLRRAPEDAAKI